MSASVATLWENLRSRIPPRTVLLVPGEFLVCRLATLPEGLDAAEIPGFAELTLEAHAPFPVEQLAWGYLHHPGSPGVLVYAAPLERLRQEGYTDWDRAHHVFPSFIGLFGQSHERPLARFIWQGNTLSILCFARHDPVPQFIASIPLSLAPGARPAPVEESADEKPDDVGPAVTTAPENGAAEDEELPELTTEDWEWLRQHLLRRVDHRQFPPEEGIWEGGFPEVLANGNVRIPLVQHLRPGDPDAEAEALPVHDEPLPFTRDRAWAADLRDQGFIVTERKSRQRGRLLWRGLQAAGAAVVFLIVLQLTLLLMGWWVDARRDRINEQMPAVAAVQNKQTLLERIERFAQKELRPFAMLRAINQARPDSVWFERASAGSFDTIEVEGETNQGITEVNEFVDAMALVEGITRVEIGRVNTIRGNTRFSLTINFDEEVLPQDPIPEDPVTEEEATEIVGEEGDRARLSPDASAAPVSETGPAARPQPGGSRLPDFVGSMWPPQSGEAEENNAPARPTDRSGRDAPSGPPQFPPGLSPPPLPPNFTPPPPPPSRVPANPPTTSPPDQDPEEEPDQ